MAKGEISWTRKTDTGERVEISVSHPGEEWIFHSRQRRPQDWQVVPDPPLADWLELLDAVTRRIGRQSMKPADAERLKKEIHNRFPDADLPD